MFLRINYDPWISNIQMEKKMKLPIIWRHKFLFEINIKYRGLNRITWNRNISIYVDDYLISILFYYLIISYYFEKEFLTWNLFQSSKCFNQFKNVARETYIKFIWWITRFINTYCNIVIQKYDRIIIIYFILQIGHLTTKEKWLINWKGNFCSNKC